jgi:GLPGLI family protein
MKKLSFLAALLLPLSLFAQSLQGLVNYTETIKIKMDIPEEHREMMKNMPTSQSFSRTLFFTETESLYKDTPLKEGEGDVTMSHESDGMAFKMVMKRPENTLYTNIDDGTTINAREFFGRNFLISGKQTEYKWKLSGENKNILGYSCQKAVYQDTSRTVEAWFTMQIPVPVGPDTYGQLPGLILEVNVNNGERTAVASKIEMKELEKGMLEKPTKGKAITQEEFKAIEAEKMKEMQMQYGGSGSGARIIIRN